MSFVKEAFKAVIFLGPLKKQPVFKSTVCHITRVVSEEVKGPESRGLLYQLSTEHASSLANIFPQMQRWNCKAGGNSEH